MIFVHSTGDEARSDMKGESSFTEGGYEGREGSCISGVNQDACVFVVLHLPHSLVRTAAGMQRA